MRDEEFWRKLMTVGFNHLTAEAEFSRVCQQGSLVACHPQGPDNKPIRVAFNLPVDSDHFLFKAKGDKAGRSRPMQGKQEDFLQDRADRMGWLPEVLREPDAIYADKQRAGTFLYVCRVSADEEFAVVIYEIKTPRGHYFVTGYVLTEPEWSVKKRTKLIKTYPRKGKR